MVVTSEALEIVLFIGKKINVLLTYLLTYLLTLLVDEIRTIFDPPQLSNLINGFGALTILGEIYIPT